MSEDSFYAELPAFDKFSDFTNEAYYAPLPSDWCIVVSDIEGSTKAIEAGRYKDVNLVGAATIAAARNALHGLDIPFVFGGDGASFAFHSKHTTRIQEAMSGLQQIAAENFGFVLRIGLVPVAEIYAAKRRIEVGRYELVTGRCLAIFHGGGLSLAEKWIKQANSRHLIEVKIGSRTNIEGLSCRWNSIPNIRGTIASLIVQKNETTTNAIYQDILDQIGQICGVDIDQINPLNIPKISYQSIRECFFQESRLHIPKWSYRHCYRIFEIIACVCIFRFKIPPIFIDPKRYVKSMRTHADYRKFDDTLRMVIDISAQQSEAITCYLDSLYKKGLLFYGLHNSKDSLMTCYVDDIHEGNHIHFIDGADGGYAMAAKQLKSQIKASST
ncbi:DUF3095 domain-containing protein [Coraliomargarita sp. SDUM461003]|uniref:DUF3095 domain-containing protein n=1 Tax=Thalassobacterium maritimum TaxID=3041265 RepID=A0ABU1AY11_9BACT|nr:DUF3095 domain-containing protein [Coraliomargarita sp. SDUM461003]MDQ8209037.1 DUF3095 domain-containing protein [Coraliomargarita sp. SDUM461003]